MYQKNQLMKLLHIDYPVVQAPMLGVSTPEMAAAASNAGVLGSLAVGGLAPDKCRQLIRQVKALTNKPFAVNLFVYDYPETVSTTEFEAMQQFLSKFCSDNGINYEMKKPDALPFYSYKELLPVLIEEQIRIVSFTFGILADEEIQLLQSKGILLIGTATSVAEACLLAEKNIDIICAQGMEAGGHRGSFLAGESLPLVGLLSLLPQVVEATQKPVLAAGGIYNKASLDAALLLGAQGVQVGSILLASDESLATETYKSAVLQSCAEDSILTRSFTGRWARGIPNVFTRAIEQSGLSIPPYPVQNILTNAIRDWARKHNNEQFLSLWVGQHASKAQRKPTADIIRELLQVGAAAPSPLQ